MSKKLRYTLIAIGFVLFLILAPAIVLYVRGVKFDIAKGQFVQTGILAMRAEPKSAAVLLDGKQVSGEVADIKFLAPKEYSVTIDAPGFQKWEKRMQVLASQVTWASPVGGKIFLFASEPKIQTAAGNVANFTLLPGKNTLVFLAGENLNLTPLNNPGGATKIPLPRSAGNILAAPSGNMFLLTASSSGPTALYVDLGAQKVTDLSALLPGQTRWYFSAAGRLYALNAGNFYAINTSAKAKTLLQTNIKSAAFLEDDLYLLKQENGGSHLEVTPNPGEEGQDIIKNLPLFGEAEIIITFEKQAILLADQTLYKVGAALEPLAAGVTAWDFNSGESSLVFFHSGQLDYINPYNRALDFISRRGGQLTQPTLRFGMSNVFFVENNSIKALELDTRSHQNEYELYKGTNIKKFALDGEGKMLVVLDGDELKTVTIR